ncbi:MAG: hypothetical protein L6R40_002626 [Gallowayella cf. fulva]|nr:MAG: hypothetical protein L6R40_002626 [Xanthomendoza cf. fulva]
MFDIPLRPLKDTLINPLCAHIPSFITPTHITLLAFSSGLLSCILISLPGTYPTSLPANHLSLSFWLLNRILDCLDGALARHRGTVSDLGGFLDLLGDFIVYTLLPIAIAYGGSSETIESRRSRISSGGEGVWMAVAVLEGAFHVNNFILFYVAALVEKGAATSKKVEGYAKGEVVDGKDRKKELTSVSMRPALIEGFESGLLFTLMLLFPNAMEGLSWTMAALVAVGIVQRTIWVVKALK